MESVFRQGGGRLRTGNMVNLFEQGAASWKITSGFWDFSANAGKKISVNLKNSSGVLVSNTQVKYAVFEFSEGIPENADFMALTAKGVYTTDASGLFEIIYTGSAQIGGFAYLAILHPNSSPVESVIWKVTIS